MGPGRGAPAPLEGITMFTNADDLLRFLRGGNAKLTLRSKKTGTHFTFRVAQPWDHDANKRDTTGPFFVSVLSGPNNENDFQFIGFIPLDGGSLIAGRKGKPNAPSFKAFDWMLRHAINGHLSPDLEAQHEGSCCRCGRTLTHPTSIATGIGPECAKHFAF